MTSTKEFHSIGHLCQLLQRSPRAITLAAQQLTLEPAMKINGISHYDGDQVETLMSHFRNRRAVEVSGGDLTSLLLDISANDLAGVPIGYEDDEDNNSPIKKPVAVYVERIKDSFDFSNFGIGS